MASSPCVLPVVSSAEQPWEGDEREICHLSRAAKRRRRHRHTAVIKAQQASSNILAILDGGAEGQYREPDVAGSVQISLHRLEGKLDEVLQFLCCLPFCGAGVAETAITHFGIPAGVMQRQCAAARTIQKAWVRRRTSRVGNKSVISNAREQLSDVPSAPALQGDSSKYIGLWEPLEPDDAVDKSKTNVEMPTEVIAALEEEPLKAVDFYDSGQTMVATPVKGQVRVIRNIPRGALSVIFAKIREQRVAVASHLGKKFDASLYPPLHEDPEVTPQSNDASDRNGLQIDDHDGLDCEVDDNETPRSPDEDMQIFTAVQLHCIVDHTIAGFVARFGHDSRTCVADYDVVADSAKQGLPSFEDDRRFTKAQVRHLMQTVTTGCAEVLKSSSTSRFE